ncbi:MAG: ThuA domain-containing protein [Chitinophaga sp.]|uniref:ThuA domain-containing protein n=1 Tax=Chitinophaga sp. TaxID=1869181 RepID=UPI0025B9902D|nr:ThuA domain-containing protein [Chitinophaga sp.]MBV8253710.1 ThuA domain-containing protein [Chitinophaga sp.]
MKKLLLPLLLLLAEALSGQRLPKAIAFYTGTNDQAHINFVKEANKFFTNHMKFYGYQYFSTQDWDRLNRDTLRKYDVVIFLDTRPEKPAQRAAFQYYMEHGGAWLGFHFSAFALTPSEFPANWDWYHEKFLGSGSYVSNTWRPTSAYLRVVDAQHPVTEGLPAIFGSAPNEWYRWRNDLRKNPDIDILLAIDSSSFPLGTGPKPAEVWHSGYYPVVWTNKKYRMVYINMGHNDMNYQTDTGLSSTFSSPDQNRLILQAFRWLLSTRVR